MKEKRKMKNCYERKTSLFNFCEAIVQFFE